MKFLSDLVGRISRLEQWQRGFTVSGAATFKNSPSGVSLNVPAVPPPPVVPDVPRATMLRISGTVSAEITGREKYEAYIQVPGSNAATVHTGTNSVGYVNGPYVDGERVMFHNHWASSVASPETVAGDFLGADSHLIPPNAVLPAFADPAVTYEMAGSNRLRVFFNNVPPPAPILVTLTQTGGSAGDASSACSFTYDVYGPSGQLIASGVSPQYPNRPNGRTMPATLGLAFTYGPGFTFHSLAYAFEFPISAACAIE